MKDRELKEILETMEPPRVDCPGARAILRRRLIAAAAQARGRTRRSLRGALLVLGAAAALMAAFWLLPSGPTAAELIRGMEAVYGQGTAAGRVHYVRQILRFPGRAPIEEERWSDEDGRRLRLLDRDAATGAILGQSILDGVRVYGSPDSRVIARRQVARLADPGEEPRKIRATVLVPSSGTGGPARAIVAWDLFDPEEFASRSGADIVAALVSSGSVEYEGTEIDAESGRMLRVLSRRIDADSLAVTDPEDLPGVADSIARGIPGPVPADASLGARERITIMADTSRIRGVTLVIDRHGEEIYRLEKIILGEALLDDSPTIFDPQAHGLAPLEPTETGETTQEIP